MRKKYFIHPSSQIKYILMSVLPAFIIAIFTLFFLVKSGEMIFKIEKNNLAKEISSVNMALQQIEVDTVSKNALDKIEILKQRISILENNLKMRYYIYLEKWAKTKLQILLVLFSVLTVVGIVALLYSHRMAGPLVRLKEYMAMLARGKNTPPLIFRKNDEFVELAKNYEDLRKHLMEKGCID